MSLREPQDRLNSAKAFCRKHGIPIKGIKPLRLRFNSLFRVPAEHLVLRVHNAATAFEDVKRELDIAQHLARNSVPTPAALKGAEDVYWSGMHFVTAWEYLQPGPAPEAPEGQFGDLLRQFYIAMESFEPPLPPFAPLKDALFQVRSLSIKPEARAFLEDAIATCVADLNFCTAADAMRPIHGDAHEGNVIWVGGTGFLIDFEAVSNGSIENDIAPMIITKRRFRPDLDLESFVARVAPRIDIGAIHPAIVRARELRMVVWLAKSAKGSDDLHTEFERRLENLSNQDNTAAWVPK
ncbi:MAG: phosphotransferase [Pseudomonadota bacterium]